MTVGFTIVRAFFFRLLTTFLPKLQSLTSAGWFVVAEFALLVVQRDVIFDYPCLFPIINRGKTSE